MIAAIDDQRGDTVQLWRIDLDRPLPSLAAAEHVLTCQEAQRAYRLVYEVHRTRFVRARAALRLLLGRRLNMAPHRIPLAAGPCGKPYVESDPTLAFNLSHSDGCAVVAIGGSNPLGVDVEVARELPDAHAVARLVFSAAELQELEEAGNRSCTFLKGWTRKEAVIKALGVGFSANARDFTVSLDERPALQAAPVSAGDPRGWTLHDVSIDGQVTALAVHAVNARVVVRSFDTPSGTD